MDRQLALIKHMAMAITILLVRRIAVDIRAVRANFAGKLDNAASRLLSANDGDIPGANWVWCCPECGLMYDPVEFFHYHAR